MSNKLKEGEAPSVTVGAGAIDNTIVTKPKKSFKVWRRQKDDDIKK